MCKALDKMEGSLNQTLSGTGITVKRFLATAKTAIQTHGDQAKLESADRSSLYLAIQKAASDGLMPDGREAALVVYNSKRGDGVWTSKVQYQPMVQGLVKLARKSGEIEKIAAFVVYEKDAFRFRVGIDDVPQHSAPEDGDGNHLWFSDRGKPIGVWAFVKLKSGEYIDPVMLPKERIDRIATRSKISGNYSPDGGVDKYGKPIGPDWEEWWKKAAIRNILKYAPKSTSLEQATNEMDKEFDFGEGVGNPDPDPINPINTKPKTESKAASTVKAKKKEPDSKEGEGIDLTPVIVEGEGYDEEEIPV